MTSNELPLLDFPPAYAYSGPYKGLNRQLIARIEREGLEKDNEFIAACKTFVGLDQLSIILSKADDWRSEVLQKAAALGEWKKFEAEWKQMDVETRQKTWKAANIDRAGYAANAHEE